MATLFEVTVRVEIPDEVLAKLDADGSELRVASTGVKAEEAAEEDREAALPEVVRRLVEGRAPKPDASRYLEFLERCVKELGAQLAVPKTGDRPYVNINPPAGRRGGRLASLNVSTGRVGFYALDPEQVGQWTHAEVVTNNGQPTYLRLPPHQRSHAEGLEMTQAVLDQR